MEDSDNASVSLASSSDESETEDEDVTSSKKTTKQNVAKMVDAMEVVFKGIAQKVVSSSSREESRDRELNNRIEKLERDLPAKLAKVHEETRTSNAEGKKRNIAIEELQAKCKSYDKKIKDLETQVSLRDKEISYLETSCSSCSKEIENMKAESKLRSEEIKELNMRINGIVHDCKKLFYTLKANDEQQNKDILELTQQGQKNIEDAAPAPSSSATAYRNMTEDERETAILSSSAEGEIDGVHFVMAGSKDAIQGIISTSPDDIQVVIVSKPERLLLRFKQEDGNFICQDCGNSSDRYHFFNLHRRSQRCRGRIVDGVIRKEMLKEIKSPRFNLATSHLVKFKEESAESGEMPGIKGLKRKAGDNN